MGSGFAFMKSKPLLLRATIIHFGRRCHGIVSHGKELSPECRFVQNNGEDSRQQQIQGKGIGNGRPLDQISLPQGLEVHRILRDGLIAKNYLGNTPKQ